MEEWRKIPGYESYEVSSLGNVRRYGKVMKPQIYEGYRRLLFSINNKVKLMRIARCVCLAFHPTIEDKTTADHINRITTDDRVENLRWADSSDQAVNRNNPIGQSGEKNIHIRPFNRYRVQIKRDRNVVYRKEFKTLPEAIEARDNFLQNINT
jgi:hypothetical protein